MCVLPTSASSPRASLEPRVRSVVADSWRRSRRSGIDPEVQNAPVDMGGTDLVGYRSSLALAAAMPVVRELLVRPGAAGGWMTALTEDVGRMLWVEGESSLRRRVETVGFVEGGVWREECAGTNALGTALATDQPVQVVGTEHSRAPVHPWNCAAVPVHSPQGRVLGCSTSPAETSWPRPRDVPGPGHRRGDRGRAGAVAPGHAGPSSSVLLRTPGPVARLRVLGHADAASRHRGCPAEPAARGDPAAPGQASRAGSAATSRGAAQPERAVGRPSAPRCPAPTPRRPPAQRKPPYRLTSAVRTDADMVHALLGSGDTDAALTAYPGPVLARSFGAGRRAIREEFTADLRAAVLASPQPAVVSRWLACDDGADDWQAWERPRGSRPGLPGARPRGRPARPARPPPRHLAPACNPSATWCALASAPVSTYPRGGGRARCGWARIGGGFARPRRARGRSDTAAGTDSPGSRDDQWIAGEIVAPDAARFDGGQPPFPYVETVVR